MTNSVSPVSERPDQDLFDEIERLRRIIDAADADEAVLAEARPRLAELEAIRQDRRRRVMDEALRYGGAVEDGAPPAGAFTRTRDDDPWASDDDDGFGARVDDDGSPDDEDSSDDDDDDDTDDIGESEQLAREVRRRDRQRVLEGLAREQGKVYVPPDGDLLDNTVYDRELMKLGVELDHTDWELEQLAHERERALRRLAGERGEIYVAPRNLWDDDVFEREMERFGWRRSASGEWEEIPPPDPRGSWDPEMGNYDRIAGALRILIDSGVLKEDFVEALPGLEDLIMVLVFIIAAQLIPGFDLLLDGYLIYLLGRSLFTLCDALSDLVTASTEEEYMRAVAEFGEVLGRIGADALTALVIWGAGKAAGKVVERASRPPRRIRTPRANVPAEPGGIAPRRVRVPEGGRPPVESSPRLRAEGGPAEPAEVPKPRRRSGGRPRRQRPFEKLPQPKRVLEREAADDAAQEMRDRGINRERRGDVGRHGRQDRLGEMALDPDAKAPKDWKAKARRQLIDDPNAELRNPRGRVLRHPEHTYDPQGRITEPGRPARDNYGYQDTELGTTRQNQRDEQIRRENSAKLERNMEKLRRRIEELLKKNKTSALRKLFRRMVERGQVRPEHVPPQYR